MKTKFITEEVYKVHLTEYNTSMYAYYVTNCIEEAISMCREEFPKGEIWSIEKVSISAKRKSTKTITVEV